MANNSINLATLDFDTIKANLKNHLRSQDIFKDYDFEGSNMAVLLDILAYNTSLQAFYTNMLAGESFLDSAQLRSSVVSHAKELNYTPRSAKSAKATVRLKVEQSSGETLTIPKGTSFTSTYNFQTYTFSTSEVKSYYSALNPTTGTYIFETDDIDIYEGFYITETFVMNYSDESQRFLLSNKNIDINSLIITSIEDNGATVISYTESDSLLGLTKQSRKYFVQAAEQDKYEIIFGDDIIGRRPVNGSTIAIQYRIASGINANGANKFVPDIDLTSDNSGRVSVTTITKASGGDQPESMASIKFNAPRHFQTQQRAITESDYETLMKSNFPEIEAISVYGGENVEPPQYGKVFIAVSVSGLDGVPESKKIEYKNYIKPKMANPIQPVFVDATYLYARIITDVKYNLNITNLKPDEVKLLVANQINNYNIDNLEDFNSTLYNSKMVRTIDDSHESVVSNSTEVLLYKKIIPKLGSYQNIDISYGVPLRSDIPEIDINHDGSELRTLYSSPFTYNGETVVIEDDGVGNLRMMRSSDNNFSIIKNIGTVDYESGTMKLISFSLDKYEGASLRFYALPASKDITSSYRDVFKIEPSETKITIYPVRQ